jgi:pSer/pThr/pTyr-binding forkhead associated (FHA) protein
MIYKHPAPVTGDEAPEDVPLEREAAVLTWDGQRLRVDKRSVLLGRSRECDIQIEDANVSRRHAELRQEGTSFWIVDLDSTNGLEVNGKRVKRAKLDPGDSFTIGSTEVTFSTERE